MKMYKGTEGGMGGASVNFEPAPVYLKASANGTTAGGPCNREREAEVPCNTNKDD